MHFYKINAIAWMFYQNQNAPTEKLSPNCQMCQLCFKTAKKPRVSVQGVK